MAQTKFLLQEKDMPQVWYNIQPDLPVPLPPVLHPGTGQPVTPADMEAIFPMSIIMQEFSPERHIPIPEELLEIYKIWRPTPLYRAHRLEKALQTPAKIFYKLEDVSPAGSHKPNTALAQAYYNKKAGIKRISTETGAGQWGSSLAMACKFFDIECKVYMVKVSYNMKPYRRVMMETWGASVVPSPSPDTKIGREILERDPECPGSLGIAISEAVEDAVTHPGTKYALGSVLNHVLLHQTIIGQEAKKQMAMADCYPDIVIGCVGGGSNFGGIALPFVEDKLNGTHKDTRIMAVEPASCPSLTKGLDAYDFGDEAGMTPMMKMFTLGHQFMPPPVHAGGLRYHGMSPLLSHLSRLNLIEATAVNQIETFEAGIQFAQTEGFISAPETNHAIRATIDEALKCRETGEAKTILFCHSGHGHVDMASYDLYLRGKLSNYEYPAELVKEAQKGLPKVSA
ncbi:MAG: TrpB-like pyridoxal phosphate-dependent enzyme [Dehalococcoides mccartyi]|nr:TrpB-like pyridoxal phosphate-dependent enzyme [Dehalococcoides mccartyi]